MNVVVMGVGYCGAFPTSGGLSYREMIRRAATMAYQEAGIRPEEIDGAISVEEDFCSGYSIADEYTPDQLGMVLKPMYTVPGDFLHGICSGAMQLRTGQFKTLVVEAFSKASNMLTKDELVHFALDPVFNRYGVSPHYLAGIEMRSFLERHCLSESQVAALAAENRTRALGNPLAPFGAHLDANDVLRSRPIASPVTELMVARPADAAIVAVLGIGEEAERRSRFPIRLTGTGWCSGNSVIERRDHAASDGTALAARMALEEAGIGIEQADVVYVADGYAHRQLMHQEALGLPKAILPHVNPDGGAQGSGELFEATSGPRFFDAVRQLREEAGAHQVPDAEIAVVQGWRGIPTDSCAVVVLSN